MFSESETAGKHLLCDFYRIQNTSLLEDKDRLRQLMDDICQTYEFTVLHRLTHQFEPQGCSIIYLLAESHFTLHTFPERAYAAVDLYTCRQYPDNTVYEFIHQWLQRELGADTSSSPLIVNRGQN